MCVYACACIHIYIYTHTHIYIYIYTYGDVPKLLLRGLSVYRVYAGGLRRDKIVHVALSQTRAAYESIVKQYLVVQRNTS